MSKISETFKNRKALITYITAGDPSLEKTEALFYTLEKAGADIIELGVPFSYPLADGPVIQASHQRALKKNVSLADVLKLARNIRKKSEVPLVLMLSDNLIVRYGIDKFYKDAQKAGVDGVIVPDLPPEERCGEVKTGDLDQIFLVAPTSTDKRIKMITDASSGFIYLVSLKGVTGKRQALTPDIGGLVDRVKKYTDKPVAVGFGISTPQQAKEAAKYADGVIVGSALVDLVGKKASGAAITRFVTALRKALDA
ncbi:MAG: tryptophan synthase subunit alpha [Candidatus Margulisbacteria bacterium]|nr:tryptophan synthase subunit alpha [Candidatus Margulisiibacteriota bacterium]